MKIKVLISLVLVSTLAFGQQYQQVRINLRTDQPFYFSGQEINIFYQITNRLDNKIIPTNEVVYVVLKGNGLTISEKKVLSKSGQGELRISIPAEQSTGNFELIAYTNYMRNLGPDNYFRKKISIYSVTKDEIHQEHSISSTFSFYPEGGQLIEDISSRVVYYHLGKCNWNQASLVDNKNKEILKFEIDQTRIGSLFFRPEKSKSYSVKHACDSIGYKSHELPEARPEGLALSITQRGHQVQIIIRGKGKSLRNDSIKVRGYFDNIKVYESIGGLRKGAFFSQIPIDKLPGGTLSFFVLDFDNHVLANRSIFVNNELYDTLGIVLSKNEYSIREKVSFEVSGIEKNASTSLYVIPQNWMNRYVPNTLNNLSEDFDLSFENLPLSKKDLKLLDDVLIKESSKNNTIPKRFRSTENYRPEELLYVRGKFIDSKPLPDSTELSFFIPQVNVVYQSRVDSSGLFEFPMLIEFYGKQKINFYPFSESHHFENPRIVSTDFSVENSLILDEPMNWSEVHERKKANYLKHQKINEVFNFYLDDEITEVDQASTSTLIEMLPPVDRSFILEEYLAFPTMEETIKEVVAGLFVRNRKGKKVLRMFYENWIKQFSEELANRYNPTPFILINNIPSSVDQFLKLSPTDVDKISLISEYSKLALLMPFGSGGIVIVDLKAGVKGDRNEQSLTFNAVGISELDEKMELEDKERNAPDFRDVLLWKPNQKTKEEPLHIDFSTSDNPGSYVIVVESIGPNGEIGYATKKIKVKFKSLRQVSKLNGK